MRDRSRNNTACLLGVRRICSGAASCVGILLLLLYQVPTASGQEVVGRAVDDSTGAPVATARVMLLDTLDNAVGVGEADSTGWFQLRARSPGQYRVHAERIGYAATMSPPLELAEGTRTEVEVRMTPKAVELEALEVTTLGGVAKLERVGFYQRRRYSVGYFLDAGQVQDQHPLSVFDLLRQMPRSRLNCPMRFVLDGWSIALEGGSTIDTFVDPMNIIGVEVYPGARGVGAPVQYRGPEAYCGIVMAWTR